MTTSPRVVDASRPRLRVEVEPAEAAELLLSVSTLLGDHAPEDFDLGLERIVELREAIAPDLRERGAEFAGGEACPALLLGLVWETPAPRRVADFLEHLEGLDPLELQLTMLGYHTRGHHLSQPETIREAALGDRAAVDALRAAVGPWEEKRRLLERILELGAEQLQERLIDFLRRWNADVFEPTVEEIRPLLEQDAEEKRALAATLPPGDFVVRATGGIQYTAPPEIHSVVFFPSWWFRPWVLMTEHKNARIFGYSISPARDDAVDLGDLARLYKALGDEKRLALLRLLRRGPTSLGEASREVGLSKSTTHHHLAILRQAGLVLIRDDDEKSYSVRAERAAELTRLLDR